MAPYYVPYFAAHERRYPGTAAVNLYDNRADAEAHVRELNRKWREEWPVWWWLWWCLLGGHQAWYVREEFILVDPDDDDAEPLD